MYMIADPRNYLSVLTAECRKNWPANRIVTVVCHGHSVPAGYFRTPEVRSLESYPHLLRVELARRFPHAVINVIVTAIGGENSESGSERFERDVLRLRPDVVTIDYSLNDRGIGLPRAYSAWSKMIIEAQKRDIRIILMTPTPDQAEILEDMDKPLNQQATQVRELADRFGVGLSDSLIAFKATVKAGTPLSELMSQGNHPNAAGHRLAAKELFHWFP